jgi:hypothetical protein
MMDSRRRAEEKQRSSAIVLGNPEIPVMEVLTDGLCEVPLDLHVEPLFAPFDLVIAVVDRDNLRRILSEARLLAAHAPILAVMSISDDDCEELALKYGAGAYWAFEWPITRLRGLVVSMLARRRRSFPD